MAFPLDSPMVASKLPLNSGLMIATSDNLMRISHELARFRCSADLGLFPAEQGLLNFMDLSGQLNRSGITFRRYDIFSELVSCPNYMTDDEVANHVKITALHHYEALKNYTFWEERYVKLMMME